MRQALAQLVSGAAALAVSLSLHGGDAGASVDVESAIGDVARMAEQVGEIARVRLPRLAEAKRALDGEFAALRQATERYAADQATAVGYCTGTFEEPELSRRRAWCATKQGELRATKQALEQRGAELRRRDAARLEEVATVREHYAATMARIQALAASLFTEPDLAGARTACPGPANPDGLARCLERLWREAVAKAVTAEQVTLEQRLTAWLAEQHRLVHDAMARGAKWRDEVLAALHAGRSADATQGPAAFTDLQPGDIVLVAPEDWMSRSIATADHLYRIAGHLADREILKALAAGRAPVSHALTFVKSVGGKRLYLDHTLEGSRVLDEKGMLQRYGHRGMYIARPQAVVDGRELWAAARTAALKPKSDYGLFGNDVVCSERAVVAVVRAAELPVQGRPQWLVDVTPGDFFDDTSAARYFLVSPLAR